MSEIRLEENRPNWILVSFTALGYSLDKYGVGSQRVYQHEVETAAHLGLEG